jgi:hypothetical protein
VGFVALALISGCGNSGKAMPEYSDSSKVTNLTLTVTDPFFSGDFYTFQVDVKNETSKIQNLVGNFYVKTEDGSIYLEPSQALIEFDNMQSLCTGNSVNHLYNPGDETTDTFCLKIPKGKTVQSFYFADSPQGTPVLFEDDLIILGE